MSVKDNCTEFLKYANTILENTDDVFVKDAMLQLQASFVTGPVTEGGLADLERARNVVQTYLEYEMMKSDTSKLNYVQKVRDYISSVGYRSDYPNLWEYVQTLQPGQIKGIDNKAMVDILQNVADKQGYALYKYVKTNEKSLITIFKNKTEYKDFVKNIANEDGKGEIKKFQQKFDEYTKDKTISEKTDILNKMFGNGDGIEPEVVDAYINGGGFSVFSDLMIFRYIVSDTATFTSIIGMIGSLRKPVDVTDIKKLTKSQLDEVDEIAAAETFTKQAVQGLSTRQLEKLSQMNIQSESAYIIQDELLLRYNDDVKLDNEYIKKIEALSAEDNRIGKVGKNKVGGEFKSEQSKKFSAKREKIISNIGEDYKLDATQAADKYDELENRKIQGYEQTFSKRNSFGNISTPQGLLAKDLAYASDAVKRSSLLNFLNEQKKNNQGLLTKDSLAMAYGMLATRIGVDNMMVAGHSKRLGLQMRVSEIKNSLRNYFKDGTALDPRLINLSLPDKLMLLGLNERQVIQTIGNYGNDVFMYEEVEKQIVSKGYDFQSSDDILSIERPKPQNIQKYQDALFQEYTGEPIGAYGVNIDKIPEVSSRPPGIPTGVTISNDPRAKVLVNDNPLDTEIKSKLGGRKKYLGELYYNPGNISEFNFISANLGVVQPRYAIEESIDTANKLQKQIVRETGQAMASTHFQRMEGVRDWVAILTQTQGRQSVEVSHAQMLGNAEDILINKKQQLLTKLREYAPDLEDIDDLKAEQLSYMMYKSDSYIYDYLASKKIKGIPNAQDIIENGIDNLQLTIPKFNKRLSALYQYVAKNIDGILPIVSAGGELQVMLNKFAKLGDKNELIEGLVLMLQANSTKVFKDNDSMIREAIDTILPTITQAFEKARASGKKAFITDVQLLENGTAFYRDILEESPIKSSIAGEYFTNPTPIGFDGEGAKKSLKKLVNDYKNIIESSADVNEKTTQLIALQRRMADEFGYLLPTVERNGVVLSDIYTRNINPASGAPIDRLQSNFDGLIKAIAKKIDEAPNRFSTTEKIVRILDHGYTTILMDGVPHRITLDDAIIGMLEKNKSLIENARLITLIYADSVGKMTLEQKRSIFAMLTKQTYIDKKIKWNNINHMSDVMNLLDERNKVFTLVPHRMYNGIVIDIPLGLDNVLKKGVLSDSEQGELLMRWKKWSNGDRMTMPPIGKSDIFPEKAFYEMLFENKNRDVFFGGVGGYEDEILLTRDYLQEMDRGGIARTKLDMYSRDMITVDGINEPRETRNITDIDTYDASAQWNNDVYNKKYNKVPEVPNTFTPTDC